MTDKNILTATLKGPSVWDSTTAIEQDGVIRLDADCLRELEAVAERLLRNPLPAILLDPDRFELDVCRSHCARIRSALDEGVGYVIVEKLPVEQYDYDITVKLYWLLMSMIGRPVAQKFSGEMIYDVLDTGKQATAGSGVRSSKTNWGQPYHNDNSFNLPPSHVGLLCLRPAQSGGESGLISFDRVYNELLEKFPREVERLYQPFWFDRQREHAEDESLCSYFPVLEVSDGKLNARFASNIIRHGYELLDKQMDEKTVRTLDALDSVLEQPGLSRNFDFQPGQIQIVNNLRLGHRRTAFVDSSDPEKKRHLVRIWLRDSGDRFYAG